MENEKDVILFYHSALRNVGLYTSVSLALLGYSRFYRGKDYGYNIAFIVLSLAILTCAIMICTYLSSDIKTMTQGMDLLYLDKWINLPTYILFVTYLVGLFGVFTLIRELRKK